MEIVLFAVAMLLIFAGGSGIATIAIPSGRPTGAIERLCLSFLFGSALVSLTSFLLGFFITGWALRLTTAILCAAVCALGLRAKSAWRDWGFVRPERKSDWGLTFLTLAQIGVAAGVARLRAMGWDGLFNWEIKARVAFLNGGAIPLSFYSDPTRPWTHPEYPLSLPLTEAWLYGWLGRADQSASQFLLLFFFAAALGLVYAGVSRFGQRRSGLWLALILLPLAPQLIFSGQGGAVSGYADFPLAVYYLAAVIFLLEYWEKSDSVFLLPFGLLAGALPWVKSDGAILWGCLIALATIKIIRDCDWKGVAPAIAPGLAVLVGWRIFLLFAKPSTGQIFLPVTMSTLRENLWRAPAIGTAVAWELLNVFRWGLLWVAALVAAPFLLKDSRRRSLIILPATVFLPIALYASVYIFTAWDFLLHLGNSFPRLLIHVSLVAALLIAIADPVGRAQKEQR